MNNGPIVAGPLATHPLATEFASVVQRVHYRYAREVVGAFSLCPFMNDPASAFGRFCVVLGRELAVQPAKELVLAAPGVVHLIYPLFEGGCHPMERFANALHEAVRREVFMRGEGAPPVHATFHPEMEGDTTTPQRLIGLVRRAPDAFVQFVPQGLSGGGTQFADLATLDLAALVASPKKGVALAKLTSLEQASLTASAREIRADRNASYARYLDAFR